MSLKETIYAFSVPCFAIMLFVPIPLFLASIPLGLLAIALVFDHQHRQIDSADWSVFFWSFVLLPLSSIRLVF
tara:strand:- start:288 stop:506 length:219 start_codon:yes stop_codon:yes gene_type:complete